MSYAQRHDSRSTPLAWRCASFHACCCCCCCCCCHDKRRYGRACVPRQHEPQSSTARSVLLQVGQYWGAAAAAAGQQQGRFKRSKSVTGLSTAPPRRLRTAAIRAGTCGTTTERVSGASDRRECEAPRSEPHRGAPATESKNKEFEDFIDGFSIDFIDPFQKKAEEKLLTKRTPNRRWSHVIPSANSSSSTS